MHSAQGLVFFSYTTSRQPFHFAASRQKRSSLKQTCPDRKRGELPVLGVRQPADQDFRGGVSSRAVPPLRAVRRRLAETGSGFGRGLALAPPPLDVTAPRPRGPAPTRGRLPLPRPGRLASPESLGARGRLAAPLHGRWPWGGASGPGRGRRQGGVCGSASGSGEPSARAAFSRARRGCWGSGAGSWAGGGARGRLEDPQAPGARALSAGCGRAPAP